MDPITKTSNLRLRLVKRDPILTNAGATVGVLRQNQQIVAIHPHLDPNAFHFHSLSYKRAFHRSVSKGRVSDRRILKWWWTENS